MHKGNPFSSSDANSTFNPEISRVGSETAEPMTNRYYLLSDAENNLNNTAKNVPEMLEEPPETAPTVPVTQRGDWELAA